MYIYVCMYVNVQQTKDPTDKPSRNGDDEKVVIEGVPRGE